MFSANTNPSRDWRRGEAKRGGREKERRREGEGEGEEEGEKNRVRQDEPKLTQEVQKAAKLIKLDISPHKLPKTCKTL